MRLCRSAITPKPRIAGLSYGSAAGSGDALEWAARAVRTDGNFIDSFNALQRLRRGPSSTAIPSVQRFLSNQLPHGLRAWNETAFEARSRSSGSRLAPSAPVGAVLMAASVQAVTVGVIAGIAIVLLGVLITLSPERVNHLLKRSRFQLGRVLRSLHPHPRNRSERIRPGPRFGGGSPIEDADQA